MGQGRGGEGWSGGAVERGCATRTWVRRARSEGLGSGEVAWVVWEGGMMGIRRATTEGRRRVGVVRVGMRR